MGAKHAFLSLAYLVGAALLFSVVRAEFWKEKTPEAERLEQYHNVPGFESSVIEIAVLSYRQEGQLPPSCRLVCPFSTFFSIPIFGTSSLLVIGG